jgi:hypothetical protein
VCVCECARLRAVLCGDLLYIVCVCVCVCLCRLVLLYGPVCLSLCVRIPKFGATTLACVVDKGKHAQIDTRYYPYSSVCSLNTGPNLLRTRQLYANHAYLNTAPPASKNVRIMGVRLATHTPVACTKAQVRAHAAAPSQLGGTQTV